MANEITQNSSEQLEQIETLFNEPDESQSAAAPEAVREEETEQEVKPDDETQQDGDENHEEVKVDYDLEVPIVNGEKLTVGALKDFYQSQQKTQADLLDRENKIMRQHEEIQQLAQYLGAVPQELVQQAQAQMQETVKQEFQAMLDAIPQWKDAVEFTKGREAIYELAKTYGLERDIGKVTDHRVIKLLFDYTRLRDGVKTAKETVKPVQKSEPKGKNAPYVSNKDKQEQMIANAKNGSQTTKLAAIETLLS